MHTSRRSRWIPWVFAGALGVVVGVNGALAYFATSTAPGLVTAHPFESGNDYNRVLAAAAAQDALGWRGSIRFEAEAAARGKLVAELSDGTGHAPRGLDVRARLVRPVGAASEREVDLAEEAPGRYARVIQFDQPGQWEIRIAAQRGEVRFTFVRRIVVT